MINKINSYVLNELTKLYDDKDKEIQSPKMRLIVDFESELKYENENEMEFSEPIMKKKLEKSIGKTVRVKNGLF